MSKTSHTTDTDAGQKEQQVNTQIPVANDDKPRLPHERDEAPQGKTNAPSAVMKQAALDLEGGMVDTDLRGVRGVEKAVKVKPQATKTAAKNAGQPTKSRN
ncbi:MAG: hypothetical protein V4805_06415 [Pseudomonadota bacterium]